ncbi:MAG: hypothetical protein ACXWE9_05430 [Methylobacter sp.]
MKQITSACLAFALAGLLTSSDAWAREGHGFGGHHGGWGYGHGAYYGGIRPVHRRNIRSSAAGSACSSAATARPAAGSSATITTA